MLTEAVDGVGFLSAARSRGPRQSDLASFRTALSKLPGPVGKTTSVQACAGAFVDGIERRKRRIDRPRWVGALRWLRPLLTTRAAESQMQRDRPSCSRRWTRGRRGRSVDGKRTGAARRSRPNRRYSTIRPRHLFAVASQNGGGLLRSAIGRGVGVVEFPFGGDGFGLVVRAGVSAFGHHRAAVGVDSTTGGSPGHRVAVGCTVVGTDACCPDSVHRCARSARSTRCAVGQLAVPPARRAVPERFQQVVKTTQTLEV